MVVIIQYFATDLLLRSLGCTLAAFLMLCLHYLGWPLRRPVYNKLAMFSLTTIFLVAHLVSVCSAPPPPVLVVASASFHSPSVILACSSLV